VVFVSLGGDGRGQIAAALTTLLSDHRVAVHSAVAGQIDPGVRTVTAELGVDPEGAFARPRVRALLRELGVPAGTRIGD
jgi:protein-tyrosine-phosphatase